MTTFWRTFHLLNIGVQFAGLAFFGWCNSVLPSVVFLWGMAWCCLWGALSWGWLKAAQTAKGSSRGEG